MFAKISKKVVAVALVATMAVTTAAVASDDTASAAMKKKASVVQGKEVKLELSQQLLAERYRHVKYLFITQRRVQ